MTTLGTDLSCTDDLTLTMREVDGALAVAEAIFRRLSTPRGGLLDDPNYGLDVRRFLHRAMTPAEREAIPGQVRQEVLKDPRIETVDVTVNALTTDTLALDVRCLTADGPFELVLAIEGARNVLATTTVQGVLHTLAEAA